MTAPVQGTWLDRLRGNGRQREAIVFEGRSLSHASLADRAETVAQRLEALGLVSGDLVALLAPPSLAGVCLIHAMLDRGIVMLPLNARSSDREILDVIASSEVRVLFVWGCEVPGETPSPVSGETLGRGLRLSTQAKCALIGFRDSPDADGLPEISVLRQAKGKAADASEPRGDRLRDPERVGSPERVRRARRASALRAQGAALVVMTSGTSGRPKGAVLTLENLMASARASRRLLGTGEADRWLLCMPIFHVGGLSILIRSVMDASCVVLQAGFDAEAVSRAIETQGIRCVSLVATMLDRLIEVRAGQRAPASLSLLLLGGGPAPQRLLASARSLGYPVAPTYGLTEAASQVATRPAQVVPPDPGDLAAGLIPLPGVELRIVDADREPVAAGGEGEIEVRGPIVMDGYLDDPVATARVLREGWLSTGDHGRLDARGHLRVLDRRSDLIVSGGENIYPAEIESVLVEFPGVLEAAVVGRADERFGARPVAIVVVAAQSDLEVSALERHCRLHLAGFKVPVEFRRRSRPLPRTASGKLLRRALLEDQGRSLAAGSAGGALADEPPSAEPTADPVVPSAPRVSSADSPGSPDDEDPER